MELQLFVADSREGLQAGRVTKSNYTLPEFDARRMWQGYYAQNPGLGEVFQEFVVRWEAEWYEQLCPQAGVVRWNQDELREEFIRLFPKDTVRDRLKQQCTSGYATVWTIGHTLEDITFSIIEENPLDAMFLDVACSLYLGIIRTSLQEYVNRQITEQGDIVLAEHSPEICYSSIENRELDERLLNVVQPWLGVDAANRPAIGLNESGMMKPLKTQCNMLFAGKKQDGKFIHLNTIPCSSCARERCLYSQFGGCHLPREMQPWLT